ncbi:Structural maintenance of chromosomes protein 3 [Nosema bombycis CQ1]|uniref:Structural maintenance of chromosomes protein 3 n=1 Tax=Nosema bombycis (strain CQ1 / CVCC 102059) TaxID=578461 RepID=R0MHZ3_NOSB1|nr:Structural maintenance of chromosomes protein 3 [Nosema bombycis CQ1]|eukprot:EOB12378.1 Structural maintenance of chromosomes protein 3 [Nosema bombycis CQ1]
MHEEWGGNDKGDQGRGKDGNIDANQGNTCINNSNQNYNTLIRIAFLNNKISYLKNPNSIKFNEIQNLELKIGAIKGEDEVLLENINFIKERLKKYKQKYIHMNDHNLNPTNDNNNIEYLRCKEKSLADFLKRKNILKIEKLEDLELEKERAKRHVLYGKRLTLMKEIGLENYKEIDLIYPELSKEDLILKLKEIKSKLKKFDFINKRALTQWNSHLEQKDTLKSKLKELKETLKKIKEFIKELDGKKERFLEFTFEMVRNNFKGFSKRMIFEMDMEIIKDKGRLEGGQNGVRKIGGSKVDDLDKGRLEGGLNEGGQNVDMKDTNLEDHNLSNFNNTPPSSLIITHNNLPLDLNLLSGGQKTMIALCLIFSIQKIDPSPFYVFDEADANLDKQSREKITDLFKEIIQEEDVQLIITTFKEELVECGNKFIGVSFKEKKSYLGEVSKEIVNEFMRE